MNGVAQQHHISAASEKARLLSSSDRGAAAWLRAIPSSYHTQLPNLDMRVALQFWLGLILPVLVVAPAGCNCSRLRNEGPHLATGVRRLSIGHIGSSV